MINDDKHKDKAVHIPNKESLCIKMRSICLKPNLIIKATKKHKTNVIIFLRTKNFAQANLKSFFNTTKRSKFGTYVKGNSFIHVFLFLLCCIQLYLILRVFAMICLVLK